MNNDFLKNNIIAHRGIYDNEKVIENTLEAFKKAIKKGYIIELDLHLTKDNEVIVFHDDKLDRLTKSKGYIKNRYYKDLKNIKLLNTNSYIPTFDEVLSLVNGKVPLLIELKDDKKGFKLEKEVIKKIDNYNGLFAIQSFRPSTIIYFRIFRNKFIRGLLISKNYNIKYHSLRMINICKPDFINVNKNLLDNKIIKKFKGIKITYLVDKNEKMLYSDKCDNMICNI
jgi:glycerophosphoryl diester phosphodiesterase